MTFSVSIGGVVKQIIERSLTIAQTANGRATASFSVMSVNRSYRPALDAEVLIIENGVRIFGGLIDRPAERGTLGGSRPGITTEVSAVDFHAYTERRYVNETLAAGTLKSQLTTLRTNYLNAYGVTLDAGQVNGPAMPELQYVYRPLTEALNELASMTADAGEPYVWRIDAFKVLRMYQPSTVTAPFHLIGDVLPKVDGDIEVDTTRTGYANRVIVLAVPKAEEQHVETFTGDGVTDTFQLIYTITRAWVVVVDGIFETLTLDPTYTGPINWIYDPVTNTIERQGSPPANGAVISITFDGTYSGKGDAQDASYATNPWEKVITVDIVPADTTVQAMAEAELAKRLPAVRRAVYNTYESGLATGQQQTITVPARNLSVTAVLTEIVIRDVLKDRLRRTVTATVDASQTNLDRGWRDVYKVWAGDKTGKSPTTTLGAGGPAYGGPGGPNQSVQFNDDGRFGGNAAFLFQKNATTVQLGTSHSVVVGSASNLLVGEGHTVS